MTSLRAQLLLPVLQAFARGLTIQSRPAGGRKPWKDFCEEVACFDSELFEWRIKPLPRTFWIRWQGAPEDEALAGPTREGWHICGPEDPGAFQVLEVMER